MTLEGSRMAFGFSKSTHIVEYSYLWKLNNTEKNVFYRKGIT